MSLVGFPFAGVFLPVMESPLSLCLIELPFRELMLPFVGLLLPFSLKEFSTDEGSVESRTPSVLLGTESVEVVLPDLSCFCENLLNGFLRNDIFACSLGDEEEH